MITRIAVAALIMTVPAGCGGADEPEPMTQAGYQRALSTILSEDAGPAVALYDDLVVHPRPQGRCVTLMRRFDERVQQIVDDVSALAPPQEVASIQEAFLASAGTSAARVSEITDEVEAGRIACGDELNDVLYGMPSSARAEEAITELENHGYVVFGE